MPKLHYNFFFYFSRQKSQIPANLYEHFASCDGNNNNNNILKSRFSATDQFDYY